MPEKRTQRMRMAISIQVEFDAPLSSYDTVDLREMADIDEEAAAERPDLAIEALMSLGRPVYRIRCQPVLV